jgi:hypothetical protein
MKHKEIYFQNLTANSKEKAPLYDVGVDGSIILKCILNRVWTVWSYFRMRLAGHFLLTA